MHVVRSGTDVVGVGMDDTRTDCKRTESDVREEETMQFALHPGDSLVFKLSVVRLSATSCCNSVRLSLFFFVAFLHSTVGASENSQLCKLQGAYDTARRLAIGNPTQEGREIKGRWKLKRPTTCLSVV